MATPASDAQSAIDVLKADNDRLNAQVAKLTSERDKAHSSHEASTKELADFKKLVGDPEAHKARVTELEQKLRTVTHKGEFRKLAEDAGAKREAIDDLFQLSGYNPTKDEIDPKALNDLLGELKKSKAYAFNAEEAAADTQGRVLGDVQPALKAIPGDGRGRSHNPASSGIKITAAMRADPKFMLDPKNKEIIADAIKNKRFA